MMSKLFKSISRFLVFFLLFSVVFMLIDLFVFDHRSNPYFNNAMLDNYTEEHIVIGSSKVYWHFVDSIVTDATIIGDGGQYNYGCLAIFYELEAKGLLKDKTIWLDLQDDSEIKAGFGKWWYFTEAFMKYGFASFSDYPLSDWSSLKAHLCRRFSVEAL